MLTCPPRMLHCDELAVVVEQSTKSKLKKKHTQKPKPTYKTKPTASYNLGYFSLWWNMMDREGIKEASASTRKLQEEDDASSTSLMNFLVRSNFSKTTQNQN